MLYESIFKISQGITTCPEYEKFEKSYKKNVKQHLLGKSKRADGGSG